MSANRLATIVFVLNAINSLTSSGIIFGYPEVARALINSGQYAELCPVGEPVPCLSQSAQFGKIYVVAVSVFFSGNLLHGTILDSVSPKWDSLLATASICLGSFITSISSSTGFDGFMLGASLIGLGGSGIHMSYFHFCNLFAIESSNSLQSTMVSIFTASGLLFIVFAAIINQGIDFHAVFGFYTFWLCVMFVMTYVIQPRVAYKHGDSASLDLPWIWNYFISTIHKDTLKKNVQLTQKYDKISDLELNEHITDVTVDDMASRERPSLSTISSPSLKSIYNPISNNSDKTSLDNQSLNPMQSEVQNIESSENWGNINININRSSDSITSDVEIALDSWNTIDISGKLSTDNKSLTGKTIVNTDKINSQSREKHNYANRTWFEYLFPPADQLPDYRKTPNIWLILTDYRYLSLLVFVVIHVFRFNFYLATILIRMQTSGFSQGPIYVFILFLLLPLGFLFFPLINFVIGDFGVPGGFFICNLLGFLYGMYLLTPIIELQLLTFFTLSFHRIFLFSSLYPYVSKIFGFKLFGRVAGLTLFVGAAVSAFQYVLLSQVGTDFFEIDVILYPLLPIPLFVFPYIANMALDSVDTSCQSQR